MARIRENAAEPRWNEERERWEFQVQRDGKRKMFTSSKPGKAGANECKRKNKLWIASDQKMSDPRLKDVSDSYLKDIENRKGIDSKLYENAELMMRTRFLPAYGNKKVSRITEQDWQELLNNAKPLSGNGELSRKTVMNIRGEISLLCKYLKKSGYIDFRPDTLEIPDKFELKQDKQILSKDDAAKLLKDTSENVYLMAWQMMLAYGFRPGEVYGLQWQDIDHEKITINRSVNNKGQITPGKNRNARRIEYLTEYAKELLTRAKLLQAKRMKLSVWVFPNMNGNPLNGQNSNHALHDYCKEKGIADISPYRLRHTFASLAKNALTEAQLKLTLGHSEMMDTGIYIHELDQDRIDTGNAINTLFKELLN